MNTGTNYIHLIAQLRSSTCTSDFDSACQILFALAADAIERALPAITSWNSPDAFRTRILLLTQNPYSPTDSCDSPEAPLS